MKKRVKILIFVTMLLGLVACQKNESSQSSSYRSNQDPSGLVTGSKNEVHSDVELEEIGGELREIEKSVNKIVGKISNKRQLYRRLGDRYLELGWLKEAYDSYKDSLAIKFGDETVHYKAAVAAASYQKKVLPMVDPILNYETAVFHYEKALEIRPGYKEAMVGLGFLYHFELKRPLDALALVDKGISGDSRPTPQLLMLRGNIYSFLARYKRQNGVNYPGASNHDWRQMAIEDYSMVIERFGKLNDGDIQSAVRAAVSMKSQLEGSQ